MNIVQSQLMDLDNPSKIIAHYFLIRGMCCFGYQDGGPMLSALASHDLTKLLYCMSFQSWDNIELVLRFLVNLTYEWNLKVVIE